MCGICGELRLDGGRVDRRATTAMRDVLAHRGPDAAGVYISPTGSAGLGFRRLKIIDLSEEANQPLGNEDGTVQVVFNGEIYNFVSLREHLVQQGHIFRSHTDTEVIVHLYEELGPRCIEKLDGMFALAIWDDRRQRLVLARDRAGKKPLFVRRTSDRVLFASEMKAFFAHPEVHVEIDRSAIPYYFLHGYVPCPQTFYRGIQQVEPGSMLTVERGGRVTSEHFWQLKFPTARQVATNVPDRPAAVGEVRRLMTAAVERRLVADVPLGAFLSGGVDSTIIVGLMTQLLDRPVRTFSIGFKDSPGYDETSYARIVADRFKTDHTEFIVDPSAFDLIDKLIWHHDGPFGDSSAVPTYIVSQLTRQHVTVVLTGDGGDELFAGYMRFRAAVAAERAPQAVRSALRILSHGLPDGGSARHWLSRAKRFAAAASLPLDERITRWSGLFYDDLEQMLVPELLREVEPIDRLQYLGRLGSRLERRTALARVLAINFETYLLDDLLVKTDRCTMATSLEARSPFLDTALMEYAATLPDSMKLSGGRTKVILRETFRDLIPDEIQRRGKMGFGIPFGPWFRGALRDVLHDLLLSPGARYREYVSAKYVHALIKRHDAAEADLGLPLWTLLCFEMWLRALPGWRNHMPAVAPTSASAN
jgi:asparagine synthase (glutamine-hydrolysing)